MPPNARGDRCYMVTLVVVVVGTRLVLVDASIRVQGGGCLGLFCGKSMQYCA